MMMMMGEESREREVKWEKIRSNEEETGGRGRREGDTEETNEKMIDRDDGRE